MLAAKPIRGSMVLVVCVMSIGLLKLHFLRLECWLIPSLVIFLGSGLETLSVPTRKPET